MDELALQVLRLSLPLVLAALSEVVAERGGVVNLGIEGMMLLGALVAYLVAAGEGPAALLLAVSAATATGVVVAALLAWFCVTLRCNQIVAGTGVHFLCLGASGLLFERFKSSASVTTFQELAFPGSALPYAGAFGLALLVHGLLFRTRWGLEVRAAGEAPHALTAAGGSPLRRRWSALLLAGALAGLAGATLTTVLTGQFVEGMTHGRGFLALSLVLFARWRPSGAVLAGLFLGTAFAFELHLTTAAAQQPTPSALTDGTVFALRSLPYALSIVALAVMGPRRWSGPLALGRAHDSA